MGKDPGSVSYENGIKKSAKKLGVSVNLNIFDKDVEEDKILEKIRELNDDEKVGGIIIFRPLPKIIDEDKISLAIDPKKDIDCMNPVNMAKVYNGDVSGFIPQSAKAADELLKFYGYDVKEKDIVIINHSNVVGKPLSMILLNELATVTICHVGTKDLKNILRAQKLFSQQWEEQSP